MTRMEHVEQNKHDQKEINLHSWKDDKKKVLVNKYLFTAKM